MKVLYLIGPSLKIENKKLSLILFYSDGTENEDCSTTAKKSKKKGQREYLLNSLMKIGILKQVKDKFP